jgi:hypothetical protein
VLPEQLACWSYPLATSDPDQASFNMVTAILCRIHQAGRVDKISGDAACGLARAAPCLSFSVTGFVHLVRRLLSRRYNVQRIRTKLNFTGSSALVHNVVRTIPLE